MKAARLIIVLALLLGGADGLAPSVKDRAELQLRLSVMTLEYNAGTREVTLMMRG